MFYQRFYCILLLTSVSAELFTNVAELSKVFNLERDLASILKEHKEQLEKNLRQIKKFSDEVKDVYEREDCWPFEEKCTESDFKDKILGNPIYNYQLLKRVSHSFKAVEKSLQELDSKSKCCN